MQSIFFNLVSCLAEPPCLGLIIHDIFLHNVESPIEKRIIETYAGISIAIISHIGAGRN